jgi:hypothetical protein
MSARELLSAIGPALVGPIRLRSNLNADWPLTVDPFHGREEGAPPSMLLALLKPEIRVDLPTGPVVYAPYGTPTADYAPLLAAGAGLLVVAVLGFGGVIGRFARPSTIAVLGVGSLLALGRVASATKGEEVSR